MTKMSQPPEERKMAIIAWSAKERMNLEYAISPTAADCRSRLPNGTSEESRSASGTCWLQPGNEPCPILHFAALIVTLPTVSSGSRCRVREANRPGNGGLRTESNPRERLSQFGTGSRNAPVRGDPCSTRPTPLCPLRAWGENSGTSPPAAVAFEFSRTKER